MVREVKTSPHQYMPSWDETTVACLCGRAPLWAFADPVRMVLLAVKSQDARVMRTVFSLVEAKGCTVPTEAQAVLAAINAVETATYAFTGKFSDTIVLGPSSSESKE